jgi:hypothetical protein
MSADRDAAVRVSALLDADDATEGSVCEGIPEEACTDSPRNFALNAANGTASKAAEQLASPGVVLPLLLATVGAPLGLAGALEPVRRGAACCPGWWCRAGCARSRGARASGWRRRCCRRPRSS